MALVKDKATGRIRATYVMDFGPTDEAKLLMQNLDEYIKLTGFTRKRFYLMGAALLIGQNQDNPRLVMQIAEYLAGVGSYRGRPRTRK